MSKSSFLGQPMIWTALSHCLVETWIKTSYYHWTPFWKLSTYWHTGFCELNSGPIVLKKIAKLQGHYVEYEYVLSNIFTQLLLHQENPNFT
jgi:hypothetical protein